ncbi:MAG: glycoside hydrolase family 38 C-terminal domain-containing protein [Candidatus Brocadiia bacterium]
MTLTPEWRPRIRHWRETLKSLIYRPLGDLELSGFVTDEQLTPEQALDGPFDHMPEGARWGGKWEYGWFRAAVEVPGEAAGQCLEADLKPGGELLVWVDGRIVGGPPVTLTDSAEPGATHQIIVETYAGHGPTPVTTGPVVPGRVPVPEPPAAQQTVGRSTFGTFEDEVFAAWMDLETLFHLRESLDQDSLRVSEIDEALREFTLVVDLELPREQMLETLRAGRERLRPLLECTNGTTAPVMYAFGHGHLDTAWLWPLAHTDRKAAKTLANQIRLAERYPEHKFVHSQPELFRRVKEHYPALYAEAKAAARAGHIVPEGSTWVEMDTNITGGESLIRQFLVGKRFYREEFGRETEMLWLPDVFGYSGAMPQIMRGCGVKYFSTAKIFWTYKGADPFPHNTFTWEGIDGSKVLVHLCNDYNSQMRPSDVINRWRERRQKDGISTRLMPFGWGDGGGGPNREHLEYVRREGDLEGVPRVRMAEPIEYFRDLEERGVPDVNYVGELYYQCHRGTYTSQARTKRGNRKAELAFREAEMWGAAAAALADFEFPAGRIGGAWKHVLTNQFHDILPGSSIRRVYEEAEAAFAQAIETADAVRQDAAAALTGGGQGATVLNSLSWERTALVPLPDGMDGADLPAQQVEDDTMVEVRIPACGWTPLEPGAAGAAEGDAIASGRVLENEHLRVEFDALGRAGSIVDKETGRELAAGPCNELRMYRDVPGAFDPWDIDRMYERTPVALTEEAQFEVVTAGPLVGVLRIRRQLNDSEMVQEAVLRRGSRHIEFRTRIDWRETHKLLKVAFPVNVHVSEGVHEIQFGHIRRPNHASRPFDADQYEVCNHKWTALAEEGRGCAVLNDCKYGVNVKSNSISLTLLKAPTAPDMTADKGLQEFTYAFYAWNGPLVGSRLVQEGYELNCPPVVVAGTAEERSLLAPDAPNVIIETVKPAEDGSGDIIVRLYESMRTATDCVLHTTLPVQRAEQTNMLEEKEADLEVTGDGIPLTFRPFEIKTVRLRQ